MKKTLILTMEVEFEDLSEEEREDIAECTGDTPETMNDLSDYGAPDLAEPFGLLETAIDVDDLLSGSEIYAKVSNIRIRNQHFKAEDES